MCYFWGIYFKFILYYCYVDCIGSRLFFFPLRVLLQDCLFCCTLLFVVSADYITAHDKHALSPISSCGTVSSLPQWMMLCKSFQLVLSCCSIAVKKNCMIKTAYKRKHLIGTCLQFPRVGPWSPCRKHANSQAWRWRVAESLHPDPRAGDRKGEKLGLTWAFEISKLNQKGHPS